jgi:hypothetical protein
MSLPKLPTGTPRLKELPSFGSMKTSTSGRFTKVKDLHLFIVFISVKKVKLDAESLAIGAAMASSQKRRRNIIDQSFNRLTFNDENLPDWFVKNEQKYCQKQMPVTKVT